jgi:hypothetical protein
MTEDPIGPVLLPKPENFIAEAGIAMTEAERTELHRQASEQATYTKRRGRLARLLRGE